MKKCCKTPYINTDRAYINLQAYKQYDGATALVACVNCGTPYIVKLISKYTVTPYNGTSKVDDWGNPIKQKTN